MLVVSFVVPKCPIGFADKLTVLPVLVDQVTFGNQVSEDVVFGREVLVGLLEEIMQNVCQ